eukprot:10426040-Alexandrium_andersonii.AAC.1
MGWRHDANAGAPQPDAPRGPAALPALARLLAASPDRGAAAALTWPDAARDIVPRSSALPPDIEARLARVRAPAPPSEAAVRTAWAALALAG